MSFAQQGMLLRMRPKGFKRANEDSQRMLLGMSLSVKLRVRVRLGVRVRVSRIQKG